MSVSNCYVSGQILCSKCPPLAETQASSCLQKFFTHSAIDFCGKAVQIVQPSTPELFWGFGCSTARQIWQPVQCLQSEAAKWGTHEKKDP